MDDKNQKIDVNFESHPPIPEDSNGIATLLRQNLLHFVDCNSLAQYLINLKDVTQVIVLEDSEEDDEDDDEEEDDETDDTIYGVTTVLDLSVEPSGEEFRKVKEQFNKLLTDKCPKYKEILESTNAESKFGFVVNERYINLPPQLALPTLKSLTQHMDKSNYTHLVFLSKILHREKSTSTEVKSKRSKSGESSSQDPPLIYVNSEEQIIYEHSLSSNDFDVSSCCDENMSWSFSSDIKYAPHRRFMIVDYKKWTLVLNDLEKELNSAQLNK